ncbi:MAG: hypothetical protein ACREQ9_15815 [Candidatus Binatia bacterium]
MKDPMRFVKENLEKAKNGGYALGRKIEAAGRELFRAWLPLLPGWPAVRGVLVEVGRRVLLAVVDLGIGWLLKSFLSSATQRPFTLSPPLETSD